MHHLQAIMARARALRLMGFLLLVSSGWLAGLTAQSQPTLQLSAFLIGVEPRRGLTLRLQQFTGAGFESIDSLRLVADGALVLHGRTQQAGLYLLALDRYSRTEIVLAPTETPHFAATVAQLARQGVYLENSPENTAYYDVLNLVQHYDTLVGQVHEQLAAAPDTSRAARQAGQYLERLHRNLNLQLHQRAARYPQTFAATVLVPLALLPERPAAEAGTAGYLPWLRAHYLDTFPFGTDLALRHYVSAARLAYYLEVLTGPNAADRQHALDQLMVRRQGHDAVNAWLYTTLLRHALARDDAPVALYLQQNYADGCAPALPYALLRQLAQVRELQPGQAAPSIALPDSTGREQSLQDFAAQHAYTVVYGWVSWCHTCQQESPKLAALQQQFGPRTLGIYAASLDEDRAAWLGAVRQKGYREWRHVARLGPLAQNEMAVRFHVRRTPKIVLLDRRARIVALVRSIDELAQVLKTVAAK